MFIRNSSFKKAIINGDISYLKKAIERYPKIVNKPIENEFPLFIAIKHANVKSVSYLLSHGANTNLCQGELSPVTYTLLQRFEFQPIDYESSEVLLDVLRLLLTSGVSGTDTVNEIPCGNRDGDTPLIYAVNLRDDIAVELLVTEFNADILIRNKFGKTAFEIAIEMTCGNNGIIDFLELVLNNAGMNEYVKKTTGGFVNSELGPAGHTTDWKNMVDGMSSIDDFITDVLRKDVYGYYMIGTNVKDLSSAYLFLGGVLLYPEDVLSIGLIGIPKQRRNEGLFSQFLISLETAADDAGLTLKIESVSGPKLKKILKSLRYREDNEKNFYRDPGTGIYGHMIEYFKKKKMKRR